METEETRGVLQAQRRFDEAELRADRAVLDELIAPDFRSIGPKGFVLDRRAWIERHDLFQYHELRTSEMEVRRFGDAAIVWDIQTNHASYADQEVRLSVRVSQTWVRLDGRWQIAGIQFSPLAQA